MTIPPPELGVHEGKKLLVASVIISETFSTAASTEPEKFHFTFLKKMRHS